MVYSNSGNSMHNSSGVMGIASAIPARFGASGTRVHLADAVETAGRWRLTTTVPACGAYTRPGSGWPLPGAEVSCTRCAKLAEATR